MFIRLKSITITSSFFFVSSAHLWVKLFIRLYWCPPSLPETFNWRIWLLWIHVTKRQTSSTLHFRRVFVLFFVPNAWSDNNTETIEKLIDKSQCEYMLNTCAGADPRISSGRLAGHSGEGGCIPQTCSKSKHNIGKNTPCTYRPPVSAPGARFLYRWKQAFVFYLVWVIYMWFHLNLFR